VSASVPPGYEPFLHLCAEIGVSYPAAWRAIIGGQIRAVMVGRTYHAYRPDVEAFHAAYTARAARRAEKARLRAQLAALSEG
jgi:hypothetical protein